MPRYFRSGRFGDAAAVVERAKPDWLRSTDLRGDLVLNTLAGAYLALGRSDDALRVLRAAGLSDLDATRRLNQLATQRSIDHWTE